MPDIFISYARKDMKRVRPIVQELEKLGWSVFWDTTILPGENWHSEIKESLANSSCVLVFWSVTSIDFKEHHWIWAEAEFGREKGILVPLLLDVVEKPIGFSHLQTADLSDWKNNKGHQGFQLLIGAIESKISPSILPVTDFLPVSKPDTVPSEGGSQTSLKRSKRSCSIVVTVVVVFLVCIPVIIFFMKTPAVSTKTPVLSMNAPSSIIQGKSEKQYTLSRRENEATKASQEAETHRKVEDVRLMAEKDAATRREAEATTVRQDTEANRKAEAARLKAEKDAATREAKAKEKQGADARIEAKAAKLRVDKEIATRQKAESEKTLQIGDKHGGGIIAYIYQRGDRRYVEGEQHGLIAAKGDLSGHSESAAEGYFTWEDAEAKCAAIGDGWYLPTKDELNKLYHAKSAVGGFSDNYYWSSTEFDANYAWFQYFNDGYQVNYYKNYTFRVRAVRVF